MHIKSLVFAPALAVITAIAAAPQVRADVIITPNGNAAAEGGASTTAPFNGPFRYQQDYEASQFGGAPFLITAIAFRPDSSQSGAFSATVANMTVMLSLTNKGTNGGASGMSSTFAANVLGAQTTVFSGGITFNSTPTGSPRAFDVVIPLTTSYLYDPSQGNLLMEIVNQSAWTVTPGGQFGFLDLAFSPPNLVPTARIFANGSPSSPTATVANGNGPNQGLVTEFIGTSIGVPEPASLGLLLFGLGAMARRRRRA